MRAVRGRADVGEAVYALLLALLVGAQAGVGGIVAPALFDTLRDRSLAGTVAGEIFARLGWLALGVLVVLLGLRIVLDRARRHAAPRWVVGALGAMLGLTALAHLWIRPWIAAVRATIQAAGGFELCDPALRARFGLLHGVSSLLFLAAALLGVALLLRLREPSAAVPTADA
jgi:hypothetical protein